MRRSFLAGLEAGHKPTGHVERGWAIKLLVDGDYYFADHESPIISLFRKRTVAELSANDYTQETKLKIVPVEIREVKE
jgi:hypothetical protein